MHTGISYMGHHNPNHIKTDLQDIQALGCSDVLVAAQENDFTYMLGKIQETPKIAKDLGIRPIAIFWGLLNLFGGGRSSQFLLSHPDCFQQTKTGDKKDSACYVNRTCKQYVYSLIDTIAAHGFKGYFIDEPVPLECYCPSCKEAFYMYYQKDMLQATPEELQAFRQQEVLTYIKEIATYTKSHYPHIETSCCLMPTEQYLWEETAKIESLDNLGTDIYWVNHTRNVKEMVPLVQTLANICKKYNKIHHEWLQVWDVRAGKEARIAGQGLVLIEQQPDYIYLWAYLGQVGTSESCDDPAKSWEYAKTILKAAARFT